MQYGRIKWFNNEKGYGFISYKNNEDIFVHKASIKDFKEIKKGELVRFKIIDTIRGFQAIEVIFVENSDCL